VAGDTDHREQAHDDQPSIAVMAGPRADVRLLVVGPEFGQLLVPCFES
jgi:hypothetical protein